jgi:hypothetical protein
MQRGEEGEHMASSPDLYTLPVSQADSGGHPPRIGAGWEEARGFDSMELPGAEQTFSEKGKLKYLH